MIYRFSGYACLLCVVSALRLDAQPTWFVDPTPVVDIRGVSPSGMVQIASPVGGARLSDGTLVVADRGSAAIRIFDGTGKLLRTIGREGSGPQEFRMISWLGRCGRDRALVWDAGLRRATVVENGSVARELRVDQAAEGTPHLLACSEDGSILYLGTPTERLSTRTPGVFATRAPLVLLDGQGKMVRSYGLVPAGEFFALRGGAFPRPLGRSASIALVGGRVVLTSGDSAGVTVIETNGTRTWFRVPSESRAPTRDEFTAAVEAIAELAPPALRARAMHELSVAPVPDQLPAYFAAFGDTDGLLWLQTSPPGHRETNLAALQLDGRIAARVRVPVALVIHEIGRDYVLGSYLDSTDEVHTAVFRLSRRPDPNKRPEAPDSLGRLRP